MTHIRNIKHLTLKLGNMRKAQDFIVYPFSEGWTSLILQSDKRIMRVYRDANMIMLSKQCQNGAYAPHLSRECGAVMIDCPSDLMTQFLALKPTGQLITLVGSSNGGK